MKVSLSSKIFFGLLVVTVALFTFASLAPLFIVDLDKCQGAQKRVEDTFKVMDACQQMLGCTITVDDLRKAQEQLNQAESCK